MSISFANAPGNLFNRLGKLGLLLKQMRTYQAAQLTNMTDTTNGVVAQFNNESDIQAVMGSAYIGLLDGGASSLGGTCQDIAARTVNRMVFRDSPRFNQDLVSQNTQASLEEVIRQMKVAGATVLAMTVTATPGGFTGVGNGVVVASVKRPLDGMVLENAYAENLTLTCVADSYAGGAVEGNESFSVTGAGSQSGLFAFNWPLGSDGSAQLSAVDGNADNSGGNLLTNSGFENWTGTSLDDWEFTMGTAGTHYAKEAGLVYDGTVALKLVGDGVAGVGTLVSFRQIFGDAAGTTATLEPLTQYAVNLYLRRDGVAAAQGQLAVELVDENGTVVKDAAGADNQFTISLTGLTTQYAAYNGAFRTPLVLPDTIYLRVRMAAGNALTSGRAVYLDKMALAETVQVYTSGPYVRTFAGSIPFNKDDYATVAVANSRGAGGTLSTLQTLLAQLFPGEVYGSELLFPSSSSPSLSDAALIAF